VSRVFFRNLSGRYLVAFAGRLAAAALHDLIERFEVGTGLAIRKETCGLQSGNLFGDGGGYELVDTGSVFAAIESRIIQ
jgi:hypothetical protein